MTFSSGMTETLHLEQMHKIDFNDRMIGDKPREIIDQKYKK